MRAFRRGFLLLMLLCLAGTAFARGTVPIVNFEHNAIVAKSGTTRTLDDVQRAIISGAARAGAWSASDVSPGRMKLTLMTRAHVATVEVTYDTQSYSIRYADSSNLNYKKDSSGEELIHPHYNGWVQKLKINIDRQLL
jgi:hypothetical protein